MQHRNTHQESSHGRDGGGRRRIGDGRDEGSEVGFADDELMGGGRLLAWPWVSGGRATTTSREGEVVQLRCNVQPCHHLPRGCAAPASQASNAGERRPRGSSNSFRESSNSFCELTSAEEGELRAAAALAGSGAGGPSEGRAGPRLLLPPPPPLQLQLCGGVWCAEWSRWVGCSSSITSISRVANRGRRRACRRRRGSGDRLLPCVRTDGSGGRKKWMGKRMSCGGHMCGGADVDKVVVGPPPRALPA
jgi:hypothetical protein